MYFAVDPFIPAEAHDQLRQLAITQPENLRWFALVDRAFDYESPKQAPAPNAMPLYRRFDMESLLKVSPVLVPLEVGPQARFTNQIDALFEHCAGRPMLSFIASTGNAEDIAKAWEDLHFVHTDDGQRFLLRFADTRILNVLPECLTPGHWAALHKVLTCWITVNRRGRLQPLPLKAAPPKVPKQLSTETLALLLKNSQPDTVISYWNENEPELLPAENRGRFWSFLQAACNQAGEDAGFPALVKSCREAVKANSHEWMKAR
jgi:hypothetical protein